MNIEIEVEKYMYEYYYHGSTIPNLREIKVYNSTDASSAIHASIDPFLALIFAIPSFGQLDFDLRVVKNQYILTERRKGFLEEYNKRGYLYCLEGRYFRPLQGSEFISNRDAKVLSCIPIENMLQKIKEYEQAHRLVIYTYPNKPSYIPKDDKDLKAVYEAYIKANFPKTKEHVKKYFPQLLKEKEDL